MIDFHAYIKPIRNEVLSTMKLGVQLYTLRDFAKTLEGFAQTLARVADIGYTTVQVSGTCAYDPDWLAAELKKNGLTCPSTHFSPDRIAEDPAKVVEEHGRFGCKMIGLGSAPGIFEPETFDFDGFVARFGPAAKIIRQAGGRLGYHNHQHEFAKVRGKLMLEHLAETFAKDDLTFILDTYWVQYAGGDPAAWIDRLAGRVHCVHLKDMSITNGQQRVAAVGDGNLNFDTVLAACARAGTEQLMVEQDECYGEDPFECLKRSYAYLRGQGLS